MFRAEAYPSGRTKDLRKQLLAIVEMQPGHTSASLADLLWSPALGVSLDLFRRRVIVQMSHLNKKEGVVEGIASEGGGRELRWRKKDTKHNTAHD